MGTPSPVLRLYSHIVLRVRHGAARNVPLQRGKKGSSRRQAQINICDFEESTLLLDHPDQKEATAGLRQVLGIRGLLVERPPGTPWLDVYGAGCNTSRAIDIRKVDRHPLASVGSLVPGLRCKWCLGSARMPKITGLYTLPPAGQATGAR